MKSLLKAPCLLPIFTGMIATQSVYGHIILTSHTARDGRDAIKQGPCGRANSERSENVYVFEPGETITLEWDEFIPHPGHFRVAFDAEGDDDFVDPADYDDFYTNDTVLLDNLYPHTRAESQGVYTQEVTLPDVECERCTLQLTQMMTDKPPYEVGTNDLYYNCIDISLRRSEPSPAPDPLTNPDPEQSPDMEVGGAPDTGDAPPLPEGGGSHPEPPPFPYMTGAGEEEASGCVSLGRGASFGWWLLAIALALRAGWRKLST